MDRTNFKKISINTKNNCFIVAEAGSNHNGSLEQAKVMIEVAKEAGVDAVKFQIFRAKTMYPHKPIQVKYLKNLGIKKSLYSIIEQFEVPYNWIKELSSYAKEKGIEFMATPFDLNAVHVLNPYVNIFKIASYESIYEDLIKEVKKTRKPVFISTGGSNDKEISSLINKILFDYLDKTVILHCIAKYPAPMSQLNLNVIPYLHEKYHVAVGYSDHTQNPITAPVAAVALGAKVIEKHFTLSRKLPGPDHAFALEPDELKTMVKAIREVEQALGNKGKRDLQKCEEELYYYKRCLYYKKNLSKGHQLKRGDFVILRNIGKVCHYFNPLEIDAVVGQKLERDRKAFDLVIKEDFK